MTEQERPRTEAPLLPGEYRVRGWDRFWSRLEDAMTEQERPRTEAGRRMLTGIQDTSERLDVALNALDYILAIEAEGCQQIGHEMTRSWREGYVEGRQQAVREIRQYLFTQEYGHQSMAERIATILDRVAGLNASESGPTCVCMNSGCRCAAGKPCGVCAGGDHYYGDASESPPPTTDIECDCGHGLQAHYGTSEGDRLPQPCSVNDCDCDDFVETERDASESPPTRWKAQIDAWPKVGDASESGQPPEASDE